MTARKSLPRVCDYQGFFEKANEILMQHYVWVGIFAALEIYFGINISHLLGPAEDVLKSIILGISSFQQCS